MSACNIKIRKVCAIGFYIVVSVLVLFGHCVDKGEHTVKIVVQLAERIP
jgi:hypothetical protein